MNRSQIDFEHSSRSSRVVVVGEVLVDRFPDRREVIGGAPMNVAWNLAGMGFNPHFVSAVGRDQTGEKILSAMRSFGLSTKHIQISNRQTGYVDVTVIDGEPTYSIIRDVAYDHTNVSEIDFGDSDDSNAVLYHGSLGYRSETMRRTIDRLKTDFVGDIFFDINIRDGHFESGWLGDLMQNVTILKCNWDEILILTQRSDKTDSADNDSMIQAAREVMRRYDLSSLWLTAGSRGAYHIGRGGSWHWASSPEIPENRFGDAVGAGDAFASRAIAGHLSDEHPEQTLNSAVRYAARVCTLRGATTTDRDFYRFTDTAI